MKKVVVITIAVVVVGMLSVGAYAHYQDYQNNRRGGWMMSNNQTGMYGPQGKMDGPRGRMMMSGGRGQMQNRGPQGKWNTNTATYPRGQYDNTAQPGWRRNAPNTDQTAQMINEEKAKEVAQAYLDKYLSGYTIDKIEKDSWRPMFFVTLKGENDALQQMTIHGFSGQVMHVFPQTAE